MKIRQYKEQDLPQIVNLFYETVHLVNAKDYTKEQLNAWAPKHSDKRLWQQRLKNNFTVVATDACTITGFASIAEGTYIDLLFVHVDCQSLGIASSLLATLEQHAKNNGVYKLSVYASITAQNFFKKHDYVLIKRNTVRRCGIALQNFLMVKSLK